MMNILLEDLQSIPPDDFERLIARLLEVHGFRNILPLGASGDEGIDIRAEWVEDLPTGDIRTTLWAVQCKKYSNSISPKETKQILDAARLPSPDFFPVPPDFFLLATSSRLTNQAKRVIERANKDRATYGCQFLVWDGDEIVKRLTKHPEICSAYIQRHQEAVEHTSQVRLTVMLDELADNCLMTFLYDTEDKSPTTLLDRTIISQVDLDNLKQECRDLTSKIIWTSYPKKCEQLLKEVGQKINQLIPETIRKQIWEEHDKYMRLASNIHEIPFELAYDPASDRFLGSLFKIGRIQISLLRATPPSWDEMSVLVIGNIKTQLSESIQITELLASKRESERVANILREKGFSVQVLTGSEATAANLYKVIEEGDFQIIHFSGHGLAEPQGTSGLVLADRIVEYDQLFPSKLSQSLIVLSACSSGSVLNDVSKHFFDRGAVGLIGFIGPVTDEAAEILAIQFYEELAKGSTAGTALERAREIQRSLRPHDFSWVSFVLFGDSTMLLIKS